MGSITLDQSAINTLKSHFGERVEVRDESGKLQMALIPEPTKSLEEMEALATSEQLARRADWSKPGIPAMEIFRMLGDG